MKKKTRGPLYDAGVFILVASLLVLGAAALSVIFRGESAFPVQVFGSAAEGAAESGTPAALRAEEGGEVRRRPLVDLGVAGSTSAGGGERGAAATDPADRARGWAAEEDWERALPAYERLVRERPGDVALQVERARALAWAGRELEGAEALASLTRARPADRALRLEAARFYWWAGRSEEADSLLGEAAARAPLSEEDAALRAQVRAAMTPTVAIARRWVEETGGARERLLLARAHVAERDFAQALPEYRAALRSGAVADSVHLELASAALAAGEQSVAEEALREYLRRDPRHRGARENLAGLLSWSERWEEAIREYRTLLAAGEDPELRFALGQVYSWAGRNEEAERELRRVAAADPMHAETFRLLGDLARWRGEWELALANYHHARLTGSPLEGLPAAIAETEEQYRLARLAAAPLRIDRCEVALESFADNQGFQRLSTRGGRVWEEGWGTVTVAVRQDLAEGPGLPAGRGGIGGYGVAGELASRPWHGMVLTGLAGLSAHGGGETLATWGAGVDFLELAKARISLRYVHQPAFRRASSLAALEAGVTSDLLTLTAAREIGATSAWAQVEAERLSAELGSTQRLSGSASLSRALDERWRLGASVNALTTSAGAPVMPGGGALYWSPELYVATSIDVGYRRQLDERWSVGATVRPGYAWVRERAGEERRFEAERTPTLGLGADAAFSQGRWRVGAGVSWSGAVGTSSYRATTLQLQGSYLLDRP